jgi:toxin ParE1/3/4
MAQKRWTIRLAAAAEADLTSILRWTEEEFGQAQARVYARLLATTLEELAVGGPTTTARDEIANGLFTLHIARRGRKGRHFLMFRVGRGDGAARVLDVLRVLHDAMDLPRHAPSADDLA